MTYIDSQGESFDLTYNVSVVDQSGNPIQGISVAYNQINGKSFLYVFDKNQKYAPALLIGTPRELENYFNKKSTSPVNPVSSQSDLKNSNEIITLTIVVLITLVTMTVAEIGFILDAYEIQQFYLSDYVTETEDYILYCKTFDEIADLINARTSATLNLTSIFVSFISVGGTSSSLALELVNSGGGFAVETLRNELLEQAITAWGVTMNDLVGKKVAVKVFPYEEDNTFSNLQNLFATYTVEYNNPICSGSGIISGTITDAETGDPISNVYMELSGEAYRTDYTNSNGEYSFENLEAGYYQVTATKNNYISETKEIDFDGTNSVINFVLSGVLASDEYRVVLTWGSTPEDLDIHLMTENGDHIYFGNKGSLTSYPYICLDIDDVSSYGPETITIGEMQSSSVYVHNYSGYPDIKNSDGIVKIYHGSNWVKTYYVPTSGTGEWWYVFDFSSTGGITGKNYLMDLKTEMKPKVIPSSILTTSPSE